MVTRYDTFLNLSRADDVTKYVRPTHLALLKQPESYLPRETKATDEIYCAAALRLLFRYTRTLALKSPP